MSQPTAGGLRVRRTGVALPTTVVRDASLSFRARGVFAFLVEHPDANARDLAENGTEDLADLEEALDELAAAGLLDELGADR